MYSDVSMCVVLAIISTSFQAEANITIVLDANDMGSNAAASRDQNNDTPKTPTSDLLSPHRSPDSSGDSRYAMYAYPVDVNATVLATARMYTRVGVH